MIQVYNPYDDNKKLLVEIPTNVEEGYPVSIDLSPDGTGVICASICVTSGAVKSQVAFYDFTDVGKNTNCLVGAQEYKDRIVAEVKYLDEDHAALFSEKGFSLWKNMKKPKQVFKKDWNREILSAFYDDRYIGVIAAGSKKGSGCICLTRRAVKYLNVRLPQTLQMLRWQTKKYIWLQQKGVRSTERTVWRNGTASCRNRQMACFRPRECATIFYCKRASFNGSI